MYQKDNILIDRHAREKKNHSITRAKQESNEDIDYLNCYKVFSSEWFISKELFPVFGLDVQFFNRLWDKIKHIKDLSTC